MLNRESAVSIDPSAFEAIQALGLGFAFAGFLASAFELFTEFTLESARVDSRF